MFTKSVPTGTDIVIPIFLAAWAAQYPIMSQINKERKKLTLRVMQDLNT